MERFTARAGPLVGLVALTLASALFFEWGGGRHAWRHSHKKPASEYTTPDLFQRWRQNYLAANADSDELGLVRGIFLGEDSFVPPETRALFRGAGLLHLLAASGYNCWIVAFAFGFFSNLLLFLWQGYLPSLTYLWLRIKLGPAFRLFGAWTFWAWSDHSPPITRSVVLISLQSLFRLLEWQTPFARVLAVQYLGSILILPRLWKDVSFELTFGCLFGIVWVPILLERLRRRYARLERIPYFLWNYLATGLGACLGTIPTTAVVFGEVNFSSLLTNWIATPPVSFLLMPSALLQMLLLFPGLPQSHTVVHALGWICAQTAHALVFALEAYLRVVPSLRFGWRGY